MNKKDMSERDICTKFINPAIVQAGSKGVKNYSKTKPMKIEEFDTEKAWWSNRVENDQAWKVSIEDIKANNFNLDIKNPFTENVDHGDPDELLADYANLLKQVKSLQGQLRDELTSALESSNS